MILSLSIAAGFLDDDFLASDFFKVSFWFTLIIAKNEFDKMAYVSYKHFHWDYLYSFFIFGPLDHSVNIDAGYVNIIWRYLPHINYFFNLYTTKKRQEIMKIKDRR